MKPFNAFLILFLVIVALSGSSAALTVAQAHPVATVAASMDRRADLSNAWYNNCNNNDDNDKENTHTEDGDVPSCTTTTKRPTATATHLPTATSQPDKYPLPSTNPDDVYGGSKVTPQMGLVGGILIILGIYLMIFGYRAFRPTLAVGGFLTFGLITWVGMANSQPVEGYTNNAISLIAVPAGLGLLGAILYFLFWTISIYLIGGMGGLSFALWVLCWRQDLVISQDVARACFLVAFCFSFCCLLFFAEKYVLLFTTSFTGALIFVIGIDFLARTGYIGGYKSILDRNPFHRVVYVISTKTYVLMAMVILLFLLSFGWQYYYNSGRKFGVNTAPAGEEGGKEGGGGEGAAPAPAPAPAPSPAPAPAPAPAPDGGSEKPKSEQHEG